MNTIDIPTRETLRFVAAHIADTACRILEVGCGDGALADHLQRRGYEVVAIDSSAEAVEIARRRGVGARVCHWPDFDDRPYDVLIFSRSLHHMHDPGSALARARQLLVPRGVVLVDDFAFADARAAEVRWFHATLAGLRSEGVRFSPDAAFVQKILTHGPHIAAWHADHDHTIHSAAAMEAELTSHVGPAVVSHVPYLYRYVAAAVEPNENAADVVERVLANEHKSAEHGDLMLIGRQFVARAP